MAGRRRAPRDDVWADSIDEIRGRRLMNVTLESGVKVTLRTVTLDELIAEKALPDDLIYIAVLEQAGATVVEMARELKDGHAERVQEMSRDLLRVRDALCARSLVGYENGDAEQVVAELDGFDKALIAGIAQRRIAVDAAGRRFGAETLQQFRGADPEPAGDPAGSTGGSEGLDVPGDRE